VPLEKYTGVFAISVNGVEGWGLYKKGEIKNRMIIETIFSKTFRF
jgi:hypothetical protein